MVTNNQSNMNQTYRQMYPNMQAGMAQYPFQQAGNVTYPFQQPTQQQGFIPMFPQVPSGGAVQTPGFGVAAPQIPGMLPLEQSYIENIFRLNKGKLVTVYMSFEGSNEWNSKVFKGIVEAAGRDHLILSDPQSGYRYLLPMVFFNYAVFEEELEYDYPFGGMAQQMTTYSPR